MAHPVNAIQDVQQIQVLPHVEAEVVEQIARHQHHPAAIVDVVQQQAVAVALQADVDQQTVVADRRLATLRRPLWFPNK